MNAQKELHLAKNMDVFGAMAFALVLTWWNDRNVAQLTPAQAAVAFARTGGM